MHAPPLTTQYPEGMGDGADWAHQTSMQRATGSNLATPYAAQLGAQSERSRIQSQAEPMIAEGVSKLNDAVGAVLGGLP